ncbi:hypothetical protein ACTHQY_04575 [Rhodococcoides corynebacterioides]|uniref:hypothetical protein n=1 Tax=Rhodococcoides corynebacterioides TaxID=53972 RepID=UPI003F7DDBDD
MSAATAAMLALPWSNLMPVDLHAFAFALRLVRSTMTVVSPLTDALDAADDSLERAAGCWYSHLDRHPDAAAMEAQGALDDVRDVLSLAGCTCGGSTDLDRRVLRAAVSDAAEALAEFVNTRSGPPVPWEVGPDAATIAHLTRAGAALSDQVAALSD